MALPAEPPLVLEGTREGGVAAQVEILGSVAVAAHHLGKRKRKKRRMNREQGQVIGLTIL